MLNVFCAPANLKTLAAHEHGRTVQVACAGSPVALARIPVAQSGRFASAFSSISRMFRRSVLNFSSKSG